jgi:type I restriction enzyme, S subunit
MKNNSSTGWQELKLGDIAKFINGRAFKPSEWETSGKMIIRIQDLTGNIENPNFTNKILEDKYLVKKGDLLISWSATLDVFIWGKEEGWLNQHIFKVEENKKLIDKNYLFYLVKTKIDEMKRNTHGSTMKHITKGNFEKIKILLPPLQIQQRIVSILEKAEKVKAKGDNAGKLLDEYLKSVFNEMFYNKGFEEVSLGKKELYENIFAGGDVQKVNLSKIKTEKFKFPIFTNGEKNRGLYGYTDTPRVTEPSITISARGTIGYPQIRNEPFYPAIRLIVLTPRKDTFNLNFLKYAIDIISFNLDGTSIPQLTIPMLSNSKYKIPLPPLPLQQKFAKIVEHVEGLKENIKKTKQNSEELFNSLMSKAFRGEL